VSERLEHPAWRLFGAQNRAIPLGVFDQGLTSASNFVTGLLLARALGPAAFGTFALLYTILVYANNVQNALICQPHNVLGVGRSSRPYARYTLSTGVSQLALAGVGAAAVLIAWSITVAIGQGDRGHALVPLAAAIAAWQAQEFVRRVLYTENRLFGVLATDLVSYGGQALVVFLLWQWDHLTVGTALFAIAATSAAGLLVTVPWLRHSFSRPVDAGALRENWHFGKWILGATTAAWLSIQLYIYLLALLTDSAAVGTLQALMLILGPLNPLFAFVDTNLPIRFAQAKVSGGIERLVADARLHLYGIGAITVAYCAAIPFFSEQLLRAVVGPKYTGHRILLVLLLAYALTSLVVKLVTAAVKALRRTSVVFAGYAASAAITAAAGVPLILWLGVNGAAIGMILSVCAAAIVQASALRRRAWHDSGIGDHLVAVGE
jgi:O-antigen/teichoic acid export membrane protein